MSGRHGRKPHWARVGARPAPGLRSKKPTGLRLKPIFATGITGQSSGRTTWCAPNVYQTTTSVSTIERVGRRVAGQARAAGVLVRVVTGGVRCRGSKGVTHRCLLMKAPRLHDRCLRAGEGQHVFAGHELVRHRVPESVAADGLTMVQ